MSKAADRSSKIIIEDLESALASLRASTTESKAVLVECPLLKPPTRLGMAQYGTARLGSVCVSTCSLVPL